jgi:hypothetical protein
LRALRFDEKIYGFRLHFLFGVTEKTVKTYVKEHLKTDDISFSFSDTWFGKCAYREANGIPHIILMLKDVPKLGCPKFHSKLNHEIVHMTWFIEANRQLIFDQMHDEQQAYLVGWITKEVLSRIKGKK